MSLRQGRLLRGTLLCSWLQLGPGHALPQGCPCAPDHAAFEVRVMGRGDSQEQAAGPGFLGAHMGCRMSPDPWQTSKAFLFPCNADINTPNSMKTSLFRFHLSLSPRLRVREHISHLDMLRVPLFTWTREDGVTPVLNLPSSE